MPLKTLFVQFCLIFNEFFLFRYEERLAVSVTNLAKTSLEADKLQKVKKSREFKLISTSNLTSCRMWDCKKNELIKLKSSGMQHWRLRGEEKYDQQRSLDVPNIKNVEISKYWLSSKWRKKKRMHVQSKNSNEIILITINIHIINNWLPSRQRMRRPKRAQNKARRTILSNSSWKMRSILSQSPRTSNSSLIWSLKTAWTLHMFGFYNNII